MTKKVLFITYLPWATPRVPGLAKYLPEFGWEPVILTPSLRVKPEAGFKIIETPCRDSLGWLKKLLKISPSTDDLRQELEERFGGPKANRLLDFLLTRGGELLNYPDSLKGWRSYGIEAGRRILKDEHITAMVSCSSPVTAHIIAAELKMVSGTPWAADLRDLWSQNHNYIYNRLRKYFDRRLERHTLSGADALVTVSRPWAEELGKLHGGKTAFAITNGFDPDTVNSPPAALTARFTITYTGLIYAGKQDPARLFTALRELIAEGTMDPDDVEVRFYGPETSWLLPAVKEFGLTGIVKQYGLISPGLVSEKQNESQLLLLLNWEDERVRGWHPLKCFGYLAAARPILATGGFGGDVTQWLLEETGAGVYYQSSTEVKAMLKQWYAEYKLHGKVGYTGDAFKINAYSQREIARKYAGVLDNITGGRP